LKGDRTGPQSKGVIHRTVKTNITLRSPSPQPMNQNLQLKETDNVMTQQNTGRLVESDKLSMNVGGFSRVPTPSYTQVSVSRR